MSKMPVLPVDTMVADCPDYDARLVREAFVGNTNRLRATKPYRSIDCDGDEGEALFAACANYVWRMLCFDFCDFRPHYCMPVTADFDIGKVYYTRDARLNRNHLNVFRRRRYENVQDEKDALDVLIKKVESVLPINAQKGAVRWMGALGIV